MEVRAEKVMRQALTLTVNQRAELAAELIASVDGEPEPDAERAWAREIERRASRVLAHGPRGDDWRKALARIRRTRPRR